MTARRRVLVIKLGALGDFALATGPFAAIRQAHPDDEIVLLTTAPFAAFAAESPYFDEVWIDDRPRGLDVRSILALRRRLRGGGFAQVYDLQTSDRSGFYFRLFPAFAKPRWSGVVRGCSHPHRDPRRDERHTIDRQAGQLADAGIPETPPPDLSWAQADLGRFDLPERFALLVPGAAPHRPAKRWPDAGFAALARHLAAVGTTAVVVGGPGDVEVARAIAADGTARSLAGETSIAELCALARAAAGAVGNDTGPMHIAAICGCPSLVLFSAESNPALSAPRGPDVAILQRPALADLEVAAVADALRLR